MSSSRTARYGLLTALALVLSFLESQMPVLFPVPGMKLGLTNIVVLTALYHQGETAAFLINLVRILLVSLTFGSMSSLMYSLAGGMLSFLVMVMCRKTGFFSIKGVSIAGGIAHNLGQILAACLILETAGILAWLPFLLPAGTAAGFLTGLLGEEILRRLPPVRQLSGSEETDR